MNRSMCAHQTFDVRRRIAVLTIALLTSGVIGAAGTVPSAFASTTVRGDVTCLSGAPVEGVWVVASSGGSGWASYYYEGSDWYKYSRVLPYGGWYSLHVGCGGSPSYWALSLTTAYTTRTYGTVECDDVKYGSAGGQAYGHCTI